jgi:hypothetical protein
MTMMLEALYNTKHVNSGDSPYFKQWGLSEELLFKFDKKKKLSTVKKEAGRKYSVPVLQKQGYFGVSTEKLIMDAHSKLGTW